jgi:alpha-tubulin suppressor-like RCC1 family protein
MTSKQARYSSLSDYDSDSSSPFIEKESTIPEKSGNYAITVLLWTAQLFFFLTSLGILYAAHSSRQGDVDCGKQLSTYCKLLISPSQVAAICFIANVSSTAV